MMNSQTPLKRKTAQSLVASFLILSMLAGLLSACNTIIVTPTPADEIGMELTPPAEVIMSTQELTLVSPTEVATEMPTLTLTPEPTATKTEIPTPTKEKSLIEGNIFFDPQSKEDFKEVALSPSPFDEPEKFAPWHEEYLKLINKKLENYDGPSVELTQTLSNAEYGTIEYYSEKWPVVGSYLFKWQGEDVLNKTYIYNKKSDEDGYVLLNITYYPESMANYGEFGYN